MVWFETGPVTCSEQRADGFWEEVPPPKEEVWKQVKSGTDSPTKCGRKSGSEGSLSEETSTFYRAIHWVKIEP